MIRDFRCVGERRRNLGESPPFSALPEDYSPTFPALPPPLIR